MGNLTKQKDSKGKKVIVILILKLLGVMKLKWCDLKVLSEYYIGVTFYQSAQRF